MGALLWWIKITYGDYFDAFILNGSFLAPLIVMVIVIFLIRIHPEPADACCKCFEDGVAFAGVFIGVKVGQWRNSLGKYDIPTQYSSLTLNIAILTLKFVLGKMTFFICRP
jgi:dihydrosphingosine 1-phosphate phosphatase